jgi:hypothetical protein
MFTHKLVLHLSSQCALACMAKTLSFHMIYIFQYQTGSHYVLFSSDFSFYFLVLTHLLKPLSLLYLAMDNACKKIMTQIGSKGFTLVLNELTIIFE